MHPINTPKNILSFKLNDILNSPIQLQTKPQSLAFGRRLFKVEIGGQGYWLKAQSNQEASHFLQAQQGFEREFNFYQECAENASLDFLMTYQLINESFQIDGESFRQAILCRHQEAYLKISLHELSIAQIKNHLLKMIEPMIQLEQIGYIHSDLKQEHFLNDLGRVCLIDFEQLQSLSNPIQQLMNATPRYMAPELFHGQLKSVQSDLYALGIIFLEWLTQTRLSAKSYQDWAYLHCQHLQVEFEPQFKCFEILLKCMLMKHKNQRLQSFDAVKKLLMTEIE